MIDEDRIYFEEKWMNIQLENKCINWRYIIRFLIRLMDVTLRVLVILMVWVVIGREYCIGIVTLEALLFIVLAVQSKKYVFSCMWSCTYRSTQLCGDECEHEF